MWPRATIQRTCANAFAIGVVGWRINMSSVHVQLEAATPPDLYKNYDLGTGSFYPRTLQCGRVNGAFASANQVK